MREKNAIEVTHFNLLFDTRRSLFVVDPPSRGDTYYIPLGQAPTYRLMREGSNGRPAADG